MFILFVEINTEIMDIFCYATYKVRSTSTLIYLYTAKSCDLSRRLSVIPLLVQPFTSTEILQTFPGVISGLQQRLSGTDERLCLFSNPDIKLFSIVSLRLSLNTNPNGLQHLSSYDRMALCKLNYY